jgi:hypothetical protein
VVQAALERARLDGSESGSRQILRPQTIGASEVRFPGSDSALANEPRALVCPRWLAVFVFPARRRGFGRDLTSKATEWGYRRP